MLRRLLTRAAALAVAILALTSVSAPAARAVPYPPVIRVPIATASSYDPCAGASNTIGGRGFLPGETVRIDLADLGEIGRAVIGADSTFTTSVTIPLEARGSNQVTVTGLTSGRTARLMLEVPCVVNNPDGGGSGVLGAGQGGNGGSGALGDAQGSDGGSAYDGSPSGDGSGSLASTGVAIGGALLLAAGLISVGGTVLVAGRRRRSSTLR